MQLSQAVDRLITAAVADGRSERTVGDYQQKLRPLVEHLNDGLVEEITPSDLRRFIAHMRTRRTRYDSHPNRRQTEGRVV